MRVWFRATHLLAQGKKGLSNIELGRRHLDQRCLARSAQADAGHARARPSLQARRCWPAVEIDDAYIGGERSGEGSGRGRRGQSPFIVAIETSSDARPLRARLQVVRGFRAGEPKRLCAGVAAGTTVVSDRGQWFRCIAEQPGIVHERHVTGSGRTAARHPAFRWANTVLANLKTASWPLTVHLAPNICRTTSAPSLGVSTAALSSKPSTSVSRSPQRRPRPCPPGS